MRSGATSLVLLCLAIAPVADAQSYAGTWRAGALRVVPQVRSWGSDCGETPRAVTTGGGASVEIRVEGDQLVLSGGVRGRTDGCWSENRSVARVSSSVEAGTWRTVCRTPQNATLPENETIVFRASGPDRIEFRETTDYNWRVRESACDAQFVATRTFERVTSTETTPPPTKVVNPPPDEPPACQSVGSPKRIVVRPSADPVAPGERVCFRARVVDAQGCAISNARTEIRIQGRPAPLGSDGCIDAPATGADALQVQVRAGDLVTDYRVRVGYPDLSDIIAKRAQRDTAPSTSDEPETRIEPLQVGSAQGGSSSAILVGAIATGILALLLLVFVMMRRAKKTGLTIPPPANVPYVAQAEPTPPAAPAAINMICPTCRRGYPEGSVTCATDGSALVDYKSFTTGRGAASPQKTKICPTCGTAYEAASTFCGKDGTPL